MSTAQAAAALPNVVYCCVAERPCDGACRDHAGGAAAPASARYSRSQLKQALQTMGCKPRRAHKACDRLFFILCQRAALAPVEPLSLASLRRELRPGVAAVTLPRQQFELLVAQCLEACDPDAPLSDFRIACALQERRACVAVLLCGTSGTGKSTLASLLAARLGITTVVSTDSIRQMMCSFAAPEQLELLRLSTYQAGEAVPPQRGARHAGDGAPEGGGGAGATVMPTVMPCAGARGGPGSKPGASGGSPGSSSRGQRLVTVQGYLSQCEAVMVHVDRLLAVAEAERRSLVLEGVHLSPALVARLMARCPSVIPFLIHISNEAKHLERFAVRAKTMTLRPERNRYVRHLRPIRAIQAELCAAADRCAVPRVDNTNVDRSLAAIHATVLGCMRRREAGEALLDPVTGRCGAVLEEYVRCTSATWSARGALEEIRRKAVAGGEGGWAPGGGPSTSAPSTPQGPLSEAAEAAAEGQGSFYGSDSQSSQGGGEGGGGAGEGGGVGAAAAEAALQGSVLGSLLETEAQSEGAEG